MKKILAGDVLVVLFFLLVGIVSGFFIYFGGDDPSGDSLYGQININGQMVLEVSLDIDEKYELETEKGLLVIEVKDNKVSIVQSPCPDKICVNMGWLDRAGEVSVCVPLKCSLTVISKDGKGELDGIAG